MTENSHFLRYLALPADYRGAEYLRWSKNGEAIESGNGRTFALTAMVAQFLEGFAAQRPLIHFCYILDLLRMVKSGEGFLEGISISKSLSIRAAFSSCDAPVRNAGVFFGHICQDMPSARLPGNSDHELAHWLTTSPYLGRLHVAKADAAPIGVAAFRQMLSEKLAEFDEDAICHWFRFGRAALLNEGQRLAQEIVEVKPPAVRGTLDDLIRQRPRLAGALPLVARMVAALSLPPRRRTPPELPLGGYADVTNRGDPERLLPTQFALDGDEFVRRFAEKELLFFQREEPQQRTREQLVLLVDQGVRTWGVVRIALSAAALAFRRIVERQKRPFSIRFAAGERINPAACDLVALADQLEASDLSTNPAELLAAEAGDTQIADADIVLLTHPRSLDDEDVKASAQVFSNRKRLFALTVDEGGAGQFSALRYGDAVPISRFRIDFNASEAPSVHLPSNDTTWTGDVEPIPYPFPIGPIHNWVELDFDANSENLLVLTQHGYLHLWHLQTGRLEVLPRAYDRSGVFSVSERVLGVRGGFVVAGKLGYQFTAAHYDLATRRVKLHLLGPPASGSTTWYVFPEIHAIAVRQVALCRALDLSTGAMYAEPDPVKETNARAQQAYLQALETPLPAPFIQVFVGNTTRTAMLHVNGGEGTITLVRDGAKQTYCIVEDGKPVQFTPAVSFNAAQLAGTVLAFAGCRQGEPLQYSWWLFSTSGDPRLLSTNEVNGNDGKFCRLSPDGRFFAIPTAKKGHIKVRNVGDGDTNQLVTVPGKIHNNLEVKVSGSSMYIVIGGKRHVLSWEHGPLKHRFEKKAGDPSGERNSHGTPDFAIHDRTRFTSVVYDSGAFQVVIDRFSQIIVNDPHRNKLVCVFRIHRSQLAAWMPEGVVYGPYDLTGRQASPDALDRLGEALRQAAAPMEA